MIFWVEFINLNLEVFSVLMTLTLHHVTGMSLIPFGKWGGDCGISPSRLGETPQKILERCHTKIIPHQFDNNMHIHFRILKIICSVTLPFSFTEMLFLKKKKADKTIKIAAHIETI